MSDEARDALLGLAPEVGSVWHWEPTKPHASEVVTVTRVTWNGEEVWIETENADGRRGLNDLSRWVEATIMVTPADELEGSTQPTRDDFADGADTPATKKTANE